MVRIKIFHVFNVKKFMKMIKESCNYIFWHLSDGTVRNLKDDSIALQSIEREVSEGCGVELSFTDSKDYLKFVYFMMGGY